MISGFRVKNLKAIADSGNIPLRRITVLVGENSAGKSSLLRLFPLLRQSVEQRTKGPILWWGRFVDFGTFQNVINTGAVDRQIELQLDVDVSARRRGAIRRSSVVHSLGALAKLHGRLGVVRLTIVLGRGEFDEVGQPAELKLEYGSDRVAIAFNAEGLPETITVNDVPQKLRPKKRWHVSQGKLLPLLTALREESFTDSTGRTRPVVYQEENPFFDELLSAVCALPHGNTSRERMTPMAKQLGYAASSEFYQQLLDMPGMPPSLTNRVAQLDPESPEIVAVRRLALLNTLPSLIAELDASIDSFASSVRYVEPVRAIAQRYYRLQDLAIDEIDSSGSNVAMYLNSLNEFEMSRLRHWMTQNLGFYAEVESESGHVQVKIIRDGAGSKNIADLGFGFSQLLPIILQAWRASNSGFGTARQGAALDPLVTIEQPELHLHPHYQAQIADVLAAVTGASRRDSRFFVETHSEHFVNRLGELIAAKRLSSKDVQILVVEQSKPDLAVVRQVHFDDQGFLTKEWPSGFFVPREL